jgi:hypothetical protein
MLWIIYIYVCVCVCVCVCVFVCVCKFYIDFICMSKIFNVLFEGLFKLSVLLKRNVRRVYKIKYYFAKLTLFFIESVKKSCSYLNHDKGLVK